MDLKSEGRLVTSMRRTTPRQQGDPVTVSWQTETLHSEMSFTISSELRVSPIIPMSRVDLDWCVGEGEGAGNTTKNRRKQFFKITVEHVRVLSNSFPWSVCAYGDRHQQCLPLMKPFLSLKPSKLTIFTAVIGRLHCCFLQQSRRALLDRADLCEQALDGMC